MKDSLYTLGYALALGAICALLLTAVGLATQAPREANAEAEKIRNVLYVLGVPFPEDADPRTLVEVYNDKVAEQKLGDLTTYAYKPDGAVQSVALPFRGPGLWGPIEGFLALEPDMETILGVTFHKQEETPGLGGEIGSPEFRRRFEGKKVAAGEPPGLKIVQPGQADDVNEIDGISGATMTCDKLEIMLNNVLRRLAREPQSHG